MVNAKIFSLTAFFLFGWIFFTFRILDVPPGINGDEASIGYNAALVSKTGRDSLGKFMPIFTSDPNSKDWKQPVTFYSEIITFKLFGPSYFSLRAVSVIFGLASCLIIFILINMVLGFIPALFSLLIFTTIPILMIQTHLALENIAPVPLVSLWLLFLAKFIRNNSKILLFSSSVFLGFSLFSYLGMRLIVPVLALLTIAYLIYIDRTNPSQSIKKSLFFLAGLLPSFLLLFLLKSEYPGSILGQYRAFNIESYQDILLPFISSFDPAFLYITGDTTPYHSTGKHGVFLLSSLPLFILGIVRTIQKKHHFFVFTLLCFFLTPLLFGIGTPIHRGSRLLVLIPFYVVISTYGMVSILSLRFSLKKILTILSILILIIINYQDFVRFYWYEYPKLVTSEFSKPIHLGFKELYLKAKEENLKPFIQSNLSENSIAANFFKEVYFAEGLNRWSQNEDIPKNSVILVDFGGISTKKDDLNLVRVGQSDYYLLKNGN
ncbi:MAG: glycosyltransferase family 39 protein [Patescibacteria group bacterium]